jgi:hypothetical protein
MVAPYATVQEPRREIGTAILIPVNNPLERLLREIRRRTRVVGAFPDGQSALNLAASPPMRVILVVVCGRHASPELWVNLGDDGLREAAYRGG